MGDCGISFDESLIFLDESFPDKNSFFDELGRRMCAAGLVKKSFARALCEREALYPTGLVMEPCPVAIPHTDPCHVDRECLAFVRFAEPLEFRDMGEPELSIGVRLAFLLAIREPKRQLKALSNIISAFSKVSVMRRLLEEKEAAAIHKILTEEILIS